MPPKEEVRRVYAGDFVFLRNAAGEHCGAEEVPDEVARWFDQVTSGVTSYWVFFLGKLKGEYGVLYLLEFPHPSSDDHPTTKKAGVKSFDDVLAMAEQLNGLTVFQVYAGKQTGNQRRHVLAMFAPFGSTEHRLPEISDVMEGVFEPEHAE